MYRDIRRQLQVQTQQQPQQQQQQQQQQQHRTYHHPHTPQQQQQQQQPVWDVEWVNAAGESHLPYDVVVRRGSEVVSYIEVKASTSLSKKQFEIGAGQLLRAAQELGPRWELALVRGARGPCPNIVRIPHALRALRQRRIQLFVGLAGAEE